MLQIDFETLATSPDAMLVSMAMVHFPDVGEEAEWEKLFESGDVFNELVTKNSKYIKFELSSQKGLRVANKETIDWWKKQGSEASIQLLKSDDDVTLEEALPIIVDFFKENFDSKTDLLYSRGNAFDISMFENYLVQQNYVPFGLFKFWNARCVRTDIGSTLMSRKLDRCHVRKDILKGFIEHNPIHDCCKDILMMYYAQQYTLGIIDYPSEEDSHEVTLCGSR